MRVALAFAGLVLAFLAGCGGGGGGNPPSSSSPGTAPIISSFTATPPAITVGQSSLLSWSTTNASSVSISGVTGAQSPNGSVSVQPSVTTTYTLTASNSAGQSATQTAIVTVTTGTQVSIASFKAAPTTTTAGQSATLTPVFTNATSASIDNGVGSVISGTGYVVWPVVTTTYILTANGTGGPVTQAVTVTVTASTAVSITSFKASATTITAGQSATLTPVFINATSASIDNGVGSVITGTGYVVWPLVTTTYTLTANGPGGPVTQAVTVTVSGGSGGTTITWRECDQANQPVWVAYQENSGPWTRLLPTNFAYSFTLASGSSRYGLAVVHSNSNTTGVLIFHGLGSEPYSFIADCSSPSPVNVSGSVSGLGGNEEAQLRIGGFGTTVLPASGGTFTNLQVAPGSVDYIGGRFDTSAPYNMPIPNKMFIRRNVSIIAPGPVNLTNVDFNGEGFVPGSAQLTINGSTASESVNAYVTFNTVSAFLGVSELKTPAPLGGAPVVWNFAQVPTANMVGTDSYVVLASSLSVTPGTTLREGRGITTINSNGGSRSLDLPTSLTAASVTMATTSPYVRMQYSWPTNLGYTFFSFTNFQGSRLWLVNLTPGWSQGVGTYRLPDFSSVPGWNNAWGMVMGSIVNYVISGGNTVGVPGNATITSATKSDQITP